jgi:hypothetical protein
MSKLEEYKKTMETTLKELIDNTEWIERYNKYIDRIEKYKKRKKDLSKYVQIPKELRAYLSISMIDSGISYDLRFRGNSVAELSIKGENVKLALKPKALEYAEHNFNIFTGEVDWLDGKAREFRKYFRDNDFKFHNKEHYYESEIITNFSKKTTEDKSLSKIQPVKLCGHPFQMPTPFKGSKAKDDDISYAKQYGGGIDILARTGSGTATKLTVIELKDTQTDYEKVNESPDRAIKQAICYATFLYELLRNKGIKDNQYWWDFFKLPGKIPQKLCIRAAVMIPYYEGIESSFANEKLYLNDSDYIELHYIYYNADDLLEKVITSLEL